MEPKFFILAGGLGTRLQSVVKDLPKPMADINGTPFLDFIIKNIRTYYQSAPIYLLTFHLSEYIEDYYSLDPLINIIKEPKKLGTGGAIKHALTYLDLPVNQSIFILNGDTYSNLNLTDFVKDNSDSDITIGVTNVENCNRYGAVEINDDRIIGFKEKSATSQEGLINIGSYFLPNSSLLSELSDESFSFEDKLSSWTMKNSIRITPFFHSGPFIDIGIPQDYQKMVHLMS